MEPIIELTLEDRYQIIKYAHQIPCTLAVRAAFNPFVELLELNDFEIADGYTVEYGENGAIKVSNPEYRRAYTREDFPVIYDAIRTYVDDLKMNSTGDKPSISKEYADSITKWLDKLVG